MADWLDIFLRLWENFGMWGIITFIVCLALWIAYRCVVKRVALAIKQFKDIEHQMATLARELGSPDISKLLASTAEGGGYYNFNRFISNLISMGELYKRANAVVFPWPCGFMLSWYVDGLKVRFHGIEQLINPEISKLLRELIV